MFDLKTLITSLAVFCTASLTLSADYDSYDPYCTPPSAASCFEDTCSSWINLPFAGEATLSYDTFRSIPDGSYNDNQGMYTGVNVGVPIPFVSCFGFGLQGGGSYGIYDWAGRSSNRPFKETQQQTFLTTGLFRTTTDSSGFNAGVVYDWMINKNYSVFPVQNTITQFRFQASYLFCFSNEFGVWGTAHSHRSKRTYDGIPLLYRSIDQINVYWDHFFDNHARTRIWVGTPYKKSLLFSNKRAGQFIAGVSFNVPLTDRLSINGHASYMGAKSSRVFQKSLRYASNICFGLAYSFGGSSSCYECGDIGIRPYMPVANNSNFIGDSNTNF